MRVIAVGQRLVGNGNRAARAFGNVLASHFGMDAAGKAALGTMHGKETAYFGKDAFERAGLVAAGRFDDIAVHRIA